MIEFIMLFWGGSRVSIVWKPAVLPFLMAIPLCAHTAQALSTGRYPLQSGLKTSDIKLIPYLSLINIELNLINQFWTNDSE